MQTEACQKKPEIWGGLECTINRVNDFYLDQCELSGHYLRGEEDLQHFADLGIKKIRYPVLWEKHQTRKDSKINWGFTEKSLNFFREKGIQPIAGLVHHGSGPNYVSFNDDSFATGLAEYASQVAERFPWIEYYTPVNEPLTTARFCGLYGFWHPHGKSDHQFLKVLLSECKATVLAMQEIRKVNPEAKLIHTEDLGKTFSTPQLQYQADFENKRRWLSLDLLLGRVDEYHPLWEYLLRAGITVEELSYFWEHSCVPEICGFNYYITSERYLDENVTIYPEHSHGGNGKHRYADVEVVRVADLRPAGSYELLKEAWARFRLPIAITETHLGCSREEQLRWLQASWQTANKLIADGVDFKAVTAWALTGSYNWCNLLTENTGEYEPGVFDVGTGIVRPTALASMIRSLSLHRSFSHPVLDTPGWWERECRVIYPQISVADHHCTDLSRPVLILGRTGTLGNAFARIAAARAINYHLLGRQDLNLSDLSDIERVIKELNPWAIINAAGFVRVDDAETETRACYLSNAEVPGLLAKACREHSIKFLTFSSDLVFDGKKQRFYVESDKVSPLNVYGKSKVMAEQAVLKTDPGALIVRTSAFFGPWDKYNFVYNVLQSLRKNIPFSAANDIYVSPTYVPDLVSSCFDLLIDDAAGIWHMSNWGEVTWSALADEIAIRSNSHRALINHVPARDLRLVAPRPKYSVLRSEKGIKLPYLENALDRCLKELIADGM